MEQNGQPQEPAHKTNWFDRHKVITGIGIVLLFGLFLSLFNHGSDKNSTATNQPAPSTETQAAETQAPSEAPKHDQTNLNVTIHAYNYSNGVEIINNDNTDLTDCDLAINGQGLSLGYTYHDQLIDKKADTTIPFGWFTKDDGTRFNIDTTALKGFYISCKEDGQLKSAYFEGNQ